MTKSSIAQVAECATCSPLTVSCIRERCTDNGNRYFPTNNKYHTLLSRRFDRREDGKHIHFASAMTLLGLNDGDNANTGNSDLDMIDFILQNYTSVEDNPKELYRRIAFNICISNSDDHFRNHGFINQKKI